MHDPTATSVGWADRIAARLVGLRSGAAALPVEPDLRGLGSVARGRAILAGEVHFGGALVRLGEGETIWQPWAPDPAFDLARHGFDWLDDLAALSTGSARRLAVSWVRAWDRRHRRGGGPGWTALATARRLKRVLALGPWLARRDDRLGAQLGRLAYRDARFLARRFEAAPTAEARIETAAILCRAALVFENGADWLGPAQSALDALCSEVVTSDGSIRSRNPETLLALFSALALTADALAELRLRAGQEHVAALARIGPTLRAMRHADGTLPRFHGGNGGSAQQADAALALAGRSGAVRRTKAMGYARLARGRTTVICDASLPPKGGDGWQGHASTLGIEVTSGRRPLIVGCGAGSGFGPDWHHAARAGAAHSVLVLDRQSSARLRGGRADHGPLAGGPRDVQIEYEEADGGIALIAAHDGYSQECGLIHVRRLDLDAAGRALIGEDVLTATSEGERSRFSTALATPRHGHPAGYGLEYALRFHLHPDVEAVIEGDAAKLLLKNGERWVFSHDGTCTIRLDPSVYLENTLPAPLACQQIVLGGRAEGFVTQVNWSLSKSEDTPDFLREMPEEVPAET